MKIEKGSLENLDSSYPGFIETGDVDRFFEEFGINFAAGHWCAGDFADRFAQGGYNSDDPDFKSDVLSQIRRVRDAGIRGIEFHNDVFLDSEYKINNALLEEVESLLAELGMRPTNMNINLFSDPRWKRGGVTNADPAIRDEAVEVALQAVDIAVRAGCSSIALWPGSDGWDYNFQADYAKMLDSFISACILINKKAMENGLVFGVEAKLHEPREGNIVISTSHKAILAAGLVNSACGGSNMGIAVDYGHEQMCAVEPADTLFTAKRAGVPVVNFHINNAKLHSNDEDRVAGTGDNWRFVDFCLAAVETGYSGWFGEDQFTYRMDPVKAMSLSRELFANMMKKALKIYSLGPELEKARASGDAGPVIDAVKKIMT